MSELSINNHDKITEIIDILTVKDISKQSRKLQKGYFTLFFETIAIDVYMKKVWFHPRQIFKELLTLEESYEWKIN